MKPALAMPRLLRSTALAPGGTLLRHLKGVKPRIVTPHINADLALEKACEELLEKHWPKNNIKVIADHRGGVLKLNLPPIMVSPNWMIVKLHDVYSARGERLIRNAAGELMERYRLSTARWSTEAFVDKSNHVTIHSMRHGSVPE